MIRQTRQTEVCDTQEDKGSIEQHYDAGKANNQISMASPLTATTSNNKVYSS